MGHTRPDWTTYGKLDQIFALYDLGELAVRLGSIVSFDRRGNILWLDDFEDGIVKWLVKTGVGYAKWDSSLTAARNGGKSAHSFCEADMTPVAKISRGIPWTVAGMFGLEVSFATGDNNGQPVVELRVYDGVKYYQASIRFLTATSLLEYLDEDNSWQTLRSEVYIHKGSTFWHTLKLVVDSVSGEYVRLLFDGLSISMASIPMREVVSTVGPYLEVILWHTTLTGVDSEIYYDDCIVTQNED